LPPGLLLLLLALNCDGQVLGSMAKSFPQAAGHELNRFRVREGVNLNKPEKGMKKGPQTYRGLDLIQNRFGPDWN